MENNAVPPVKKSPVLKVIVVIFILGMLWLVVANLPRGYSRDLSQIGKGKNVVVQVHDHNLVGSIDLMDAMNTIRPEYAAAVEFVPVNAQERFEKLKASAIDLLSRNTNNGR